MRATAGGLVLLLTPLCVLLLAVGVLAVFLGSAPVSPEGIVRALTGRAAPGSI
jgi:ABC-type Fe3+-siderophore transport system permease subunit